MSITIPSPTTNDVAVTVLDPIEPEGRTYSEPVVRRAVGSAVVEFDIISGNWRAYESIAIDRIDGALRIGGRASDFGDLTIPAPILPVVLAEIERVMSGEPDAPFEPLSAAVVAADRAPFTGVVPTAVAL